MWGIAGKGLVLLVVAAAAMATRQVRLRAFDLHQQGQRYEDIYYLPSADWLRAFSLGFHDALADLIWCRSLVYFGEELGQRGEVKHVFEYTDAILTLDPDFREPYRWVAMAAIYRPKEVSMADGLRAAEYLHRAVQRWPSDGELHWDYGSLLRFELAPLERDRARKQQLIERAAPHLEIAARKGEGPPWLALNSADLLNKLGRTEQAIRHLEELYGTVRDESVKQEIEQRLTQLRTESYVVALKEAHEQLERSRAASYPYLSQDLFLLVGERKTDRERWLADGFLPEEFATDDR